MNQMKLSVFACVISSMFLLQGCFSGAPAETISEESIELQGTKWQLIDRYDLNATIEFNGDITKLTGNDGCNDFSADIELKNYFMQFSKFVNTKKACQGLDDRDRDFLVALSKVRDYTVTRNKLSLQTLGLVYIGDRRANTINFNIVE